MQRPLRRAPSTHVDGSFHCAWSSSLLEIGTGIRLCGSAPPDGPRMRSGRYPPTPHASENAYESGRLEDDYKKEEQAHEQRPVLAEPRDRNTGDHRAARGPARYGIAQYDEQRPARERAIERSRAAHDRHDDDLPGKRPEKDVGRHEANERRIQRPRDTAESPRDDEGQCAVNVRVVTDLRCATLVLANCLDDMSSRRMDRAMQCGQRERDDREREQSVTSRRIEERRATHGQSVVAAREIRPL